MSLVGTARGLDQRKILGEYWRSYFFVLIRFGWNIGKSDGKYSDYVNNQMIRIIMYVFKYKCIL